MLSFAKLGYQKNTGWQSTENILIFKSKKS